MFSRLGLSIQTKPVFTSSLRQLSTEVDKVVIMKTRISENLSPMVLDIQDVSGGCGAFFKMLVVSDKFEGKAMLARHRLVQGILKDEIADMHGLTLTAFTPKQYEDSLKE